MPELPEVETVRRGLQTAIAGKSIKKVELARADLRFPLPEAFAARLKGRRLERIERRAKYLLLQLDGGLTLLAHLGMSGHFRLNPTAKKHDHVLFTFTDGTQMAFNDPRRFGMMDLVATHSAAKHKLLAHLGPEPLEKAFNTAYLHEALLKRKGPLKPALMDQKLVVGVGNIYASEALFLAKLDPRTPAHAAAGHAGEIIAAIRKVLRDAIASGGSSLRDFFHTDGETGLFQHRFAAYDRAGMPCFTCGCDIHSLAQAGRTTFFCPQCQSKPRPASIQAKKPRKTAAFPARKKVVLGA